MEQPQAQGKKPQEKKEARDLDRRALEYAENLKKYRLAVSAALKRS